MRSFFAPILIQSDPLRLKFEQVHSSDYHGWQVEKRLDGAT